MGTKRTKKEEAPAPVSKLAPKRKMAVRAPEPAKPAVKPAAKAPIKAPAKAAPAVAAAPKPARKAAAPVTKVAVAMEITMDDIALRAYYIGEARQTAGLPGDSTTDWLEAERQLRADL